MPTCKDCKHYKPKPDEPNKGECFGHQVSGDMDASLCPAKAFTPKQQPARA